MTLRHYLKFIILIISLPIMTSVNAQEKLILNTAFSYPLSTKNQQGFVDLVVNEALSRIGYSMEAVQLPAERALINANLGIDDGDLIRIGGLSKLYPNLIQVPEEIIDLEFMVFTKDNDLKVKDWSSLNNLSVAIVTGWKILEKNITNSTSLTKVKNLKQLYTILMKDRVDIIVYSKWVGLGYIRKNNLKDIRVVEPPLAKRKMYVYLHKKHKAIVATLAAALKDMKNDGSYMKLFKQKLASFYQY